MRYAVFLVTKFSNILQLNTPTYGYKAIKNRKKIAEKISDRA